MSLHDAPTTEDATETPDANASSRRNLIGKSTIAAVAALAAGTYRSSTAAAAEGDAILLGRSNSLAAGADQASASTVVQDAGEFVVNRTEGSLQRLGSLSRNVKNGQGDPQIPTGAYGFTRGTTESRAVWGQDESNEGVGVYGTHWRENNGTGVFGESFNGIGVVAKGSDADIRAIGSGLITLNSAGDITPTTPAAQGTIGRDSTGVLWYAFADNRWTPLTGPNGASDQFTAIDPSRVYDSRAPQPANERLFTGNDRLVSVASGRNLATGAIEFEAVPAGAKAITYNVTVANTIGTGFLTVNPGDKTAVTAASVNWFGDGQILANAGTVRIDTTRNVRVICGGIETSTNFVIDVTGYYR